MAATTHTRQSCSQCVTKSRYEWYDGMTTPLCHTPVPACMHSVGRRATRMRLQLQRCMPNIHIFGTQTPKVILDCSKLLVFRTNNDRCSHSFQAASLERKALSTQPGSTSPVRNRQDRYRTIQFACSKMTNTSATTTYIQHAA